MILSTGLDLGRYLFKFEIMMSRFSNNFDNSIHRLMQNLKLLFFFVTVSLLFVTQGATGANDTLVPANDSLVNQAKKVKRVPLEPYHRNVIKFNPTPMLLFTEVRNFTLSYERLITRNQSLAIQAGYLLLPKLKFLSKLDKIVTFAPKEKYGINLALDYRYYLFPRNNRPAPDGLYAGAFVSYYGFKFENHLDLVNTSILNDGIIHGKLNVMNFGLNLGYQFIFWKRFSLDLLMLGPSYSFYSGELGISGGADPALLEEIDEELIEAVTEQFPLLGALLNGENLEFTGYKSKWKFGFRYSVQLGFHF